jgi:hypothetical protein
MERKYRQRGYSDRDAQDKKKDRPDRPDRPSGEPRPKQDMLGPRTPRMVGTVMRARCSNCGAVLAPGFDPNGQCPRCKLEMHSCKQCVHFDTALQFECTQPIPERIAKKDAKNECTFFEFRMTVEKDTSPVNYATNAPVNSAPAGRPNDARKAFEDLFKK